MLSMRTMVDRRNVGSIKGRIGFDIGGETFVAEPDHGRLPIRRGDLTGTDAVFRAPSAVTMAGGLYAGVPWEDLERGGDLVIEGNRMLALRYAALFNLPPKLA
jgi:hypothetical protein